MPDFLCNSGYRPDLIVENQGESIVIEVTSRESVARSRELLDVLEKIDLQKGWAFELVMTVPNSDEERNADEELLNLYELSNSRGSRYSHAVLLTAWTIVEAVLRMLLHTDERDKQRLRSPRSLVRDGVMLGFIELEDGEFLDRMALTSTRIAHGGLSERVAEQDVKRLVEWCKSKF